MKKRIFTKGFMLSIMIMSIVASSSLVFASTLKYVDEKGQSYNLEVPNDTFAERYLLNLDYEAYSAANQDNPFLTYKSYYKVRTKDKVDLALPQSYINYITATDFDIEQTSQSGDLGLLYGRTDIDMIGLGDFDYSEELAKARRYFLGDTDVLWVTREDYETYYTKIEKASGNYLQPEFETYRNVYLYQAPSDVLESMGLNGDPDVLAYLSFRMAYNYVMSVYDILDDRPVQSLEMNDMRYAKVLDTYDSVIEGHIETVMTQLIKAWGGDLTFTMDRIFANNRSEYIVSYVKNGKTITISSDFMNLGDYQKLMDSELKKYTDVRAKADFTGKSSDYTYIGLYYQAKYDVLEAPYMEIDPSVSVETVAAVMNALPTESFGFDAIIFDRLANERYERVNKGGANVAIPYDETIANRLSPAFDDLSGLTNAEISTIAFVKAQNLMSGDGGLFRPYDYMTRAEGVTVIQNLLGLDSDTISFNYRALLLSGDLKFSDAVTHWARERIEVAASMGIVAGSSQGVFEPDRMMTDAELLTMCLKQLMGNEGYAMLSGSNWIEKAETGAKSLGLIASNETVTNTAISRLKTAEIIEAAYQLNE